MRSAPSGTRPLRSAGRDSQSANGNQGGSPNRSGEFERTLELASVLETASDAVVGVTPQGSITSWGAGAERLFGYTGEDALGRPISMLAPPGRPDEPGTLIQRVLAGHRVDRVETERVSKDGRALPVLLSLRVTYGHRGEATGVVGIFRDLSGQRSAEDAWRESERRYESLVEALSEGVVMYELESGVVAFNSSSQRILGVSPEEFVKGTADRGSWSLLDEAGVHVSADRYPTTITLRTGTPQSDVVLGVEIPDIPTRWISVSSRPLTHPGASSPYAVVASLTDVTELRATMRELQDARSEDLRRLALIGEYRDDDTNRHTERVGHSAELMARTLGLDDDLMWTLRRAAPLHDVGKIGIPDEILLKRSKLTREEFEIMKTHTTIGERILSDSQAPVLRMAARIALTHHERWDGARYPCGLEGDRIPIVSRIVAVADAFDAMTHARPYKPARSIKRALAELKRCTGTQFDLTVVAAFMELEHVALVET